MEESSYTLKKRLLNKRKLKKKKTYSSPLKFLPILF